MVISCRVGGSLDSCRGCVDHGCPDAAVSFGAEASMKGAVMLEWLMQTVDVRAVVWKEAFG
jgi:hypothetical protein